MQLHISQTRVFFIAVEQISRYELFEPQPIAQMVAGARDLSDKYYGQLRKVIALCIHGGFTGLFRIDRTENYNYHNGLLQFFDKTKFIIVRLGANSEI